MNLAWIAAVLQPYSVTIHPNFRDESYSHEPAGQLAALVIGGDWAQNSSDFAPHDDAVLYAEKTMRSATVSAGVDGLIERAFSPDRRDMARSTALILLACCAAAGMEEYEKCDSILSEMMKRTDKSPSGRLAKAVLVQQRALRRRDAGVSYVEDIFEAARLLEELDTAKFPDFLMGPGANSTPAKTVKGIIYSMKRSAWSLTPPDYDTQLPFDSFPTRMSRLKMPLSDRLLRISTDRAAVYSQHVKREFNRRFGNPGNSGQAANDLFHEALAVELLAHADVYRARQELALLRLVQRVEGETSENLQGTLRLLRQAGARKELELALEGFRSGGPLSALSWDARQILLRRASPQLLRVPELLVLKSAAEIMAEPEAEQALEAVLASINSGGPPNVAGASQHPVVRRGVAWQTAAALSNTCGKEGRVAALLLSEVRSNQQPHELHDRNIAKTIGILTWEFVPDPIKVNWEDWLTSESNQGFDDTVEAIAIALGHPTDPAESFAGLDEIAMRLNTTLGTGASRLEEFEVAEATRQLKQYLTDSRESAERGIFSFSSRSAAEISAALIQEYDPPQELWSDLALFLTCDAVPRMERNLAFDRLARDKPNMPNEIREMFRATTDHLLDSVRADDLWGDTIVPYPAALRFLISYDLLDDARIVSALASLNGSSNTQARRQAARTLAFLSSRETKSWLLPFALQMSHESDVPTKANAARFLSRAATSAGEFNEVATERLVELLANEDGLLVPLFVMRELEGSTELPPTVAQALVELAQGHPSWRVRKAASSFTEVH